MKLKVHAQRKFAQGAYIPPSASANTAERRVDGTPSKEEIKHVYFNRMSAVSLLDIVAFQNMHSHTEPVVILERLEEIQEAMSQPVAEVNGSYASTIKKVAANGTANHNNKSKPARPLRYLRPKRTGGLNQRTQKQSMHLRSRLGSTFKPKSRAVKKCRQKPSVVTRMPRRRRVPSPAESYDLDDDKPLTYIAQVLRRTVPLRSDRNLRKRRGEELPSTSKRRARVPITTRPQKPTQPTVPPATSSKVTDTSDDDTDTDTANGPSQPQQTNPSKPSSSSTDNGFRVIEATSSKINDTGSDSDDDLDINTANGPSQTSFSSGGNGFMINEATSSKINDTGSDSDDDNETDDDTDNDTANGPTNTSFSSGGNGFMINEATSSKVNDTESDTDDDTDTDMANGPTRTYFSSGSNGFMINEGASCSKQIESAPWQNKQTPQVAAPGISGTSMLSSYVGTGGWMMLTKTPTSSKSINTGSYNNNNTNTVPANGPTQTSFTSGGKQFMISDDASTSKKFESAPWRRPALHLTPQPTPHLTPQLMPQLTPQVADASTSTQFDFAPWHRQTPQLTDAGTVNISSPAVSVGTGNWLMYTELPSWSTSQAPSTIQSNNLELKTVYDKTLCSVQNNDIGCRASSQASQTSQTGQINDLNVNASLPQTAVQNIDVELGAGLRAQSTVNNNLNSTPPAQLTSPNNGSELGNTTRPQPTNQNNFVKLRSSSRGQPMSYNKPIEPKKYLRGQPSTQNNDRKPKNSWRAQPPSKIGKYKSNWKARHQPTDRSTNQHNGLKLRSSSQAQPATPKNNVELKAESQTQPKNNDLDAQSSSQSQPTGQNNDIDSTDSPQAKPMSQNHDINSTDSPQGKPISQNNNIDSTDSPQGKLTSQNNDIDVTSSSHAQSTSRNNDLEIKGSSQTQPTSQNKDLNPSSQAQTTSPSDDIDLTGSSQAQPTGQNNDAIPTSTTQAQPTAQNNMPTRRDGSQARPMIQNSNVPRINNNGQQANVRPDLRGNLLAQLLLGTEDLDLLANAMPLSPIQNYDWSFGALRTRPSFQNNFRGRQSIRDLLSPRTNTMMPLTVQNDLGLRGFGQALPSVRNSDANHGANSRPGIPNNVHGNPNPIVPPTGRTVDLKSIAQSSAQSNNLQSGTASGAASGTRNNGPAESSEQRSVYRNDAGPVGGWSARSSFRSFNHRPRSMLLNDEIGASSRHGPNSRNDFRPPIQAMRAQAKYWNMDPSISEEKAREQQLRSETLAAANKAARAERIAAVNAERERTERLDEALRECVLTAQSVTNGEMNQRPETLDDALRDCAMTAQSVTNGGINQRPETLDEALRDCALSAQGITKGETNQRTETLDEVLRDCVLTAQAVTSRELNKRPATLDEALRSCALTIQAINNGENTNQPTERVNEVLRQCSLTAQAATHREMNKRTERLDEALRECAMTARASTNREMNKRTERLDEALRQCALTAQAVTRGGTNQCTERLDEALRECAMTAQAVTNREMKKRTMTLDEALRDCALTAQAVTNVERNYKLAALNFMGNGMQRRQAIAARQQQLAESNHLARRNATKRILSTGLGVNGQHRTTERRQALPPQKSESESETESGPSKLRRKRQTSSLDSTASSRTQEREAEQHAKTQPQSDSESDQELPRGRKKKLTTSSEDSGSGRRLSDKEEESQSGPSKLRRKNGTTLTGGMTQRAQQGSLERQPEPAPRKSLAGDRSDTGAKPQEHPNKSTTNKSTESSSKTAENSTSTSTATSSSSRPSPSNDTANEKGDIEIPTVRIARCVTSRRPMVEGWLKSMATHDLADDNEPHFKVPRIPALRKSTEKRTVKPQKSDRDDSQSDSEQIAIQETKTVSEKLTKTAKVLTALPKRDNLPFPVRETLAEPIIQPKNACLSKHFTTVRSIVHATDSQLADRCGHCIYCSRVDKIRKLSSLVQNQRKPAAATNEVYDFDADREDSHENTRLYNFRQNRKPKLLEPANKIDKDTAKDPVYLDVLPPQNPHIIEITSVQMPNQSKPMLRARLIRKTDANLENEFSLIEHENLLDQLLEIKIANSEQTAKKAVPNESDKAAAGPSKAESAQGNVRDSSDVVECDSDEFRQFLARLQTKMNTKKAEETKPAENTGLLKKPVQTETKKLEPAKKAKSLRKGQDETMRVELPKNYLSESFSRCFREAPIFYPTEEEFLDPLVYFEKIFPVASQFGLCKVVAPSGFRPKCTITDDVRFNVANQYISRLYCRWGAASKEMCAIKAYLADQKVFFTRPPLIEGIELNLPKLYRTVQRHGGLKKVIEKKRWGRVAEEMRFPRGPRSAKRIDQLYVKHLLPYDTLSNAERRELMNTVENSWNRNYKKMLNRASNPLHRQKRLMGESESSDEMDTDEDATLAYALAEAEDCVVTGRCMKLSVFKKVASNVMCTLFPHSEQPSPKQVEEEYWKLVSGAAEHVCVNAASIDTGEEGYGFPRSKYDPYSKHPWNLKMFSQNSGNVLRSLGPVLGVTVPTLHLGMVFATSCWHRDPHGLPWVEYMHHGPPKIWYGIPDELSADFRKAVEKLCPTSCQNKSIWLPSDITMIPPHLLNDANVPLSRVVQNPGEFILVCPKAYSSSIATGYTESESVYFAPTQWLTDVSEVFQELRASCEPTMFSLSQLLLAVALDERTPDHVVAGVSAALRDVVAAELTRRDALARLGVELVAPEPSRTSCSQARKRPAGAWNVREQDECEICRTTLYLSKVTGLTSKRSSFCLEHALLLIEKDKKAFTGSVTGVVATIFVLRAELEDAVRRVENRLKQ